MRVATGVFLASIDVLLAGGSTNKEVPVPVRCTIGKSMVGSSPVVALRSIPSADPHVALPPPPAPSSTS